MPCNMHMQNDRARQYSPARFDVIFNCDAHLPLNDRGNDPVVIRHVITSHFGGGASCPSTFLERREGGFQVELKKAVCCDGYKPAVALPTSHELPHYCPAILAVTPQ